MSGYTIHALSGSTRSVLGSLCEKAKEYVQWSFFIVHCSPITAAPNQRGHMVYFGSELRPDFLPSGRCHGLHSYVSMHNQGNGRVLNAIPRLSWADTAASTIGRLWGSKTPPLPSHLPILRLPFAARKSSAGFLAATVTGACISAGFWGLLAPIRTNPADVSWIWDTGVSNSTQAGLTSLSGWVGLGIIAVFAGLVGGIAEALGEWLNFSCV